MALILQDRVRETTNTTGTGTFTLLGAVTGYQSFSVIGNGNTCFYACADQGGPNWEVGLGTYSSGTLARTTVLSSSNSGSLVNFTAGTKDVFVTQPSEKAVYLDGSGNITPSSVGPLTVSSLTDSGLTSGRVTYAGTAGLLQDSANLTFNGTTLTANTLNLTNALGVSYGGTGLTSLTAGYIPYGNGTSAFSSTSNLQYSSTVLSAGISPSTWNLSGYYALEIGVAGNSIFSGLGDTILTSNAYYNGAWKYGASGVNSGLYEINGNVHLWKYASAGTAGNTIGFTEAMRIDSSGNVGIGTASPNAYGAGYTTAQANGSSGGLLQATVGGSTIIGELYASQGLGLVQVGTRTNHPLAFKTNSVEAMRIDSSGNVGIGTSSPSSYGKLAVVSGNFTDNTIGFSVGTSTSGNKNIVNFQDSSGITASITAFNSAYGSGSSYALAFNTNSAERMRIDSSGNLLIGTTTGGGRLTVDAGASSQYGTFNAATAGNCGYVMKYAGTQFGAIGNGSFTTSGGSATDFGISAANNLIFDIGITEKMRIDASGNLCVGTSTSSAKLTVASSSNPAVYFSAPSAAAGTTGGVLGISSSTVSPRQLYFGIDESSGYTWEQNIQQGVGTTPHRFYSYTTYQGQFNGGGAWFQGNNSASWSTTSDERVKENIVSLSSGLNVITALRPVEFDYKISKSHDIGFIAQEYQKILPEQINESAPLEGQEVFVTDGKVLGITPNLIPYLVKAIQEQQALIESLTTRLTALENK